MTTDPNAATPLASARDWLKDHLDEGAHCPLCQQFAKIYKRRVHATMARDLILFYGRVPVGEFAHVATTLSAGRRGVHLGDFAKLAYWGLIEEELILREDGGRAGFWRVTAEGASFVRGWSTIPKYARIYDGRRLGFAGDPVGIRDALGAKFDYSALMRGES